MRESLGIALDSSSISTTLVDADTPLLGSIDEFRHPWGEDGSVPPAAASARALASAADVAIERASRSHLHPTSVGVMCEWADVRDLVPESFSSQAIGNVELVNSLDARLAYLRSVDALAGVSPILAFWPDGSETVIAAIDPRAGTIDSAHRYNTAELLANSATFTATLDTIVAERDSIPKMLVAMGAPEQTRQMSAAAAERSGLGFTFLGERTQLAIGAALVAAARSTPTGSAPLAVAGGRTAGSAVASIAEPRRWTPLMVFSTLLVLGGLLIGTLFTLAPDNASTATTDPSNNENTPSSTVDEHQPANEKGERRTESENAEPPGSSRPEKGESTGSADPPPLFSPSPPESLLPPCDPVVPATPAGLRRSDPDIAPTSPTPTPDDETCTPIRQG
ncbi:hypothetical protein [Rhodococcus erythropolis]|uniref:hypothetical protein n=1 Tax=Rhodococcus erythropolis TaxID=1833 RepID=UPI002227D28A|nr:hypothetical protein [Rhodococcus erythropolis]MCW2295510.1 hypothetical protein [Rhodococcus erythropolis]